MHEILMSLLQKLEFPKWKFYDKGINESDFNVNLTKVRISKV